MEQSQSKTKYFLSSVLASAIWGFFAIPLRNLKAYPSEEILYYRVFASLAVIWLAIFVFRFKYLKQDVKSIQSLNKIEKRKLSWQFLLSTILLILNWYTFIYAINNVSLKSGAFAYMVCPLITAFGGFLILKEPLTKLKLISLVIALFSIIILAKGSFIDVIWSVIIASFYAFYLILQKKMQGLDKLNSLAFQFTIAVVIMLPFFFHSNFSFPTAIDFWANILIIAVLFTIIPLFLNLYALIGIPSSTAGIIIYVYPVIAFALAIFYFDESISNLQIGAYSLILFAVFLFNWNVIRDILKLKTR